MEKQEYKWLPPTDHKPIEWESIALIGFRADGWPEVICTIEPGPFLKVLKSMALEEINDGIPEDETHWEEDEELDCFELEIQEKSLRWALFPVDVAKEIFSKPREEERKKTRKHEDAAEPAKPLPNQLTLPISE